MQHIPELSDAYAVRAAASVAIRPVLFLTAPTHSGITFLVLDYLEAISGAMTYETQWDLTAQYYIDLN